MIVVTPHLGDAVLGLAGSTRRWQYRPWMVILFGAELTFACQHVLTYPVGRFTSASGNPGTSPYVKEWLANTLYFSLVRAFSTAARRAGFLYSA